MNDFMSKRPTQADVARVAGVSRATVSYVLNDMQSTIPISSETRQRVLSVIAQLGYEPDTRAQSLRSGNSKTIGLLVPDLHNPHFWETVEGVEEEARKAGYDVLLAHSSMDITREEYCLRALSRRTISGLIFMKTTDVIDERITEQLATSNHPVVESSSSSSRFDCVLSNYRSGMKEILEHLLNWGHQHFAFIHGVINQSTGLDRLEPFNDILQKAGIARSHRQVIHCGITPEDGYQAAHKLLSQKPYPTAVIAINDLLAMGVLRAANDLGLKIPQDISLVGFDDLPFSSYMVPRLTTVKRDTKKGGQMLMKLLLERIQHPDKPQQIVKMPAQVVLRESTGPAPRRKSA